MTFTDRLGELVQACFTGIWIESHEHPDALASLAQLCRQENWNLAFWDVDQGLRVGGAEAAGVSAAGPLVAVRAAGALRTESGTSLVVLVNFHRFLQSAEVVQALARQIVEGKQTRTIYVVLAPIVRIPVELEKLFTVVEHELPDRAQLAEIARGVATSLRSFPTARNWRRSSTPLPVSPATKPKRPSAWLSCGRDASKRIPCGSRRRRCSARAARSRSTRATKTSAASAA